MRVFQSCQGGVTICGLLGYISLVVQFTNMYNMLGIEVVLIEPSCYKDMQALWTFIYFVEQYGEVQCGVWF